MNHTPARKKGGKKGKRAIGSKSVASKASKKSKNDSDDEMDVDDDDDEYNPEVSAKNAASRIAGVQVKKQPRSSVQSTIQFSKTANWTKTPTPVLELASHEVSAEDSQMVAAASRPKRAAVAARKRVVDDILSDEDEDEQREEANDESDLDATFLAAKKSSASGASSAAFSRGPSQVVVDPPLKKVLYSVVESFLFLHRLLILNAGRPRPRCHL